MVGPDHADAVSVDSGGESPPEGAVAVPDGLVAASRDAAWAYLRSLGCNRDEADDLAQEVALAMTAKRPVVAGASGACAWARQAAKYFFLTGRRTAKRREELLRLRVEPEARANAAELAYGELEDGRGLPEVRLALRACLGGLDERAKAIVFLHYREGLTGLQVAAKLGLGEQAVHTALHRVRARLRECIRKRMKA